MGLPFDDQRVAAVSLIEPLSQSLERGLQVCARMHRHVVCFLVLTESGAIKMVGQQTAPRSGERENRQSTTATISCCSTAGAAAKPESVRGAKSCIAGPQTNERTSGLTEEEKHIKRTLSDEIKRPNR